MPDESCRSCGGELATYSLCSACRKVTQKVCKCCNAPTRKQFHNKCIKSEQISMSKRNQVAQLVHRGTVSRKPAMSGRSLVMIFGVIGFFTLGFATASYLGMFNNAFGPIVGVFQNQPHSVEATNPHGFISNVGYGISSQVYENCLAYGSGESLTVTCPTNSDHVYKAILGMPKDLADKFSDTVFSIRGISLTENPDGSVILDYQNIYYKTNFFAS
jgi:hypothetical protein